MTEHSFSYLAAQGMKRRKSIQKDSWGTCVRGIILLMVMILFPVFMLMGIWGLIYGN